MEILRNFKQRVKSHPTERQFMFSADFRRFASVTGLTRRKNSVEMSRSSASSEFSHSLCIRTKIAALIKKGSVGA
jgi:hypothetical protein